jgi:hypothetical protein
MNRKTRMQWACAFVLISSLLSACGAANHSPAAGEWKADTEFGGVDFTVSPDSKQITDATFNFSNFQCGPGSQSGSIQVTYNDGLKIDDGQIKIEFQNTASSPVPPDPFNPMPPSMDTQIITLTGKFNPDGKSAAGDWTATFDGATCSQGKWNAVPGNK